MVLSKRGHTRHTPRIMGFTLVEAVVVIALTGILAAGVALFIRAPVQGYADLNRRAELTDIADTALRRINRDVRGALPNSVRVTSSGSVLYLEFLAVRTAGRYRAEPATAGDTGTPCPGDALLFNSADTCFKSLGNLPAANTVVAGDWLVLNNGGQGIVGSDAYLNGAVTGGNKAQITGLASGSNEERITFQSITFTDQQRSSTHQFQVVSGPVSYVCDPANGTLTRYWGYSISTSQPTSFTGASSALLASKVSACSFTYDGNALTQAAGLVSLSLTLTSDGESVRLFQQVHVDNMP